VRPARLLLTAALLTGVALAPTATAAPLEQPLGPVLVLAHRGASYDAPEHTRPAYDKALRDGTDFLECDLQLTKDEVLVCVHDTTVDRTTGGQNRGRVDAYTLKQLRSMDFGSWFNTTRPDRAQPSFAGQRVVTLEEQLGCYLRSAPRSRFHLETKAPKEYAGKMEPALVRVLSKHGLLDTGDAQTSRVVVQSFELASLEVMSRLAPKVPRAYLFAVPGSPAVAAGELPEYVDIAAPAAQFLLANPQFPAVVHDRGIEVHTYTVDDEPTMEHLLDLGVDGVFTNRPDVLRKVVDDRGTGTRPADRGPYTPRPGCA
jgi:glycerophosphoryl diester phosphodiesterase